MAKSDKKIDENLPSHENTTLESVRLCMFSGADVILGATLHGPLELVVKPSLLLYRSSVNSHRLL